MENRNQYQQTIIQETDILIKDRLEFRRLVQTYRLTDLVGDENECIEWLERQVNELAFSMGSNQQFRELLQRRKEMLRREREGEQFIGDIPCGKNGKKPPPLLGKKFRRFNF